MPQCELADRVTDSVVAKHIRTRLVRYEFILSIAPHEEISLNQTVSIREALPAESDLKRLRAISSRAGEILEEIVMQPGPLRHSARAWSANGDHLTQRSLILKGVVIDLAVVSINFQISALAGELENIPSDSTVSGAGTHLNGSNSVRKLEASNDNKRGRAVQTESRTAPDLSSARGRGIDHDWMRGGPLSGDGDGRSRRVDAIRGRWCRAAAPRQER